MIARFDKNARERPDAIAVWQQQTTFTYHQLQEASEVLAQRLQAWGVTAGGIVGVCLPAGFDLLVAILAIGRCRAVYLPLDPDHPPAHQERILTETQPQLVIRDVWTNSETASPLRFEETAYIMYTSGTTGQPKGVMISWDNLAFYLESAQQAFRFHETDIFCNVARATFSISLFDLLLPLTVGASVRFLERGEIFDRTRLVAALAQSTVFHAGPSLLATLFRYGPLPNLRHVSSGGDLVLPQVMEGMKRCFPNAELFVIYGTTEISCMGTWLPLTHTVDKPLVGRPFPGVSVELWEGEICFSGPGIGQGYFQKPELTADRFQAGVYRTGDYGRWDADGNLEMIGRRDFQVQLRGVRIELTGIENHILELGLATHCAVVHQQKGEDSGCLVAFLAGAPAEDGGRVRGLLSDRIPAEWVPARFVFLPQLPTTFNGKIDRRAMMDWPMEDVRPEGAWNDEEKRILDVLRFCLDLPQLRAEQNFFEAGGHSLLAIHVLSELSERHAIHIPPLIFFQRASARELAAYWMNARGSEASTTSCQTLPLNTPTPANAIFLVAGAPIYRPLAQALDQHWTAYALVSEEECNPLRPASAQSMEDLARSYARSIIERQRSGPYYILGYSFAGILAFEIARQLTASGHEVRRLFLLDAALPENVFRWRHRFRQIARIWRTRPTDLFNYLRNKLARSRNAINPQRAMDYERGRVATDPRMATDYERGRSTATDHERGRSMATDYERGRSTATDHERGRSTATDHDRGRVATDPRTALMDRERGHRNRIFARDYMKRMPRYAGAAVLFVAGGRLKKKPLLSRSCGWRPYLPQLKIVTTQGDHHALIQDPLCLQHIIREIHAAGA